VHLETLEGRALLSHAHAAATLVTAQPAALVHLPQRPHPGPIVNWVGVGYAVKSPRFYELYTGKIDAVLNAAGMKATYDEPGNLVLTGIVAGQITSTPQSVAQSEYYVFGIDHGLTTGPGPFPGRPNIRYDAIVAVSFTPEGVRGFVLDLVNNVLTPLTADNILNQGFDFKVFVPAGTPGIGSTSAGTNPKVVFWAQDAPPTPHPAPQDIASFAPDGRTIPIAGAPGQKPPPHLL
jgi:hypothetical protein